MIRAFSQFRMKQWGVVLLLVFVGSFAITVNSAAAQTSPDTLGLNQFEQSTSLGGQDIRITVAKIINIFLSVIGVLAVIIVLYGGFIYMTAGGNEEKIGQARRILINGALGLLIIFSSWAITKYVLTKLQNATGTGLQSNTTSSTTRLTQTFNCTLNPAWCCARDNFIVQSITPRSDDAQLNNDVVRAVFSRSVRPPVNTAFQILRDSIRVDNEFSVGFADPSQRVIQATYIATSTCATPGCMPAGSYEIRVQDVRDNNNNVIETSPSCGTFPKDARFNVNVNGTIDATPPSVPGGITFNGVRQQNQPLPIGRFASTTISISDNTGAGYLRFTAGPENRSADVVVYDGPLISRGSDAPSTNPYVFNYPLSIRSNVRPLQRYLVNADITDIDSNVQTVSSSFVTVADHCFNNVRDGNETGIDAGGSCLSTGSCTENWQCASGQCTQGQCLAIPIITRVDPWDGAAGNWVTIIGRFFGDANGQVAFGRDLDGNGIVTGTEWVATQLAQCNGLDVWKDNWVIVEIPSDAQFPQGTTSSIRVTRADNVTYFDTTTNARGPVGGPNNGLFTKSTIVRPGICRVETIATSAVAATPRTPVRILGQGFTNSGVLSFGGRGVPTSNWTIGVISAIVPEQLQPGLVGVNVTAANQVSNGFPFEILAPGEDLNPVISSITPVSVTNNSMFTISGRGFGNRTGRVFLTTDPTATCTQLDVTNNICFPANTTLGGACGVTWTPQQVIAQVIGLTNPTQPQFFVRLRNNAGFQTTGSADTITVASGAPTPGICRINPAQGPAPRSSVRLTGSNFATPVSAHFWSETAVQNPTSISAWPVFTSGAQITLNNSGSLDTPIPITATNETMLSGPIHVQAAGGLSNAIRYDVLNCVDVPDDEQPAGYHCCDDGTYRADNVACPNQTRDAGYVWRFTTGKTPNYPYVIQQCQNNGASPSPSPSQQWDDGREACINAQLNVRFNLDMDPATVQNGIQVFTCVRGAGNRPDCSNKVPVTSEFTIAPLTRGAQIIPNSGTLASNTWYHVELLTSIQSQHNEVVLAQNILVNEPLRRTRPCSDETAFCFDFQTDDQLCTLADAFIDPPEKETALLGMIQDSRYPLSFIDPYNAPHPFYFYLWGQANRACIVLPVDGLGWQWGPTAVAAAVTAAPAPSVGSRRLYTDSRASAIARQNTSPGSVLIQATTSTLTATSSIKVDLGDPKVVDYWPNCTESCTNANIGVRFSTYMITSTYAGAFTIQECTDALCTGTTGVNIQYNVVSEDPIMFRVSPVVPLIENRWYQVVVTSTARAATALGSATPGNPLTPFTWRFRTKAQDGFCIAGQVIVEPHPFTARVIGQKTPYRAIPYSSPNQCSTRGQGLNPWGYGWQWQTLDRAGTQSTLVASTTQFRTVAAPKPFCTQRCLPSGSDVQRTQTSPPLCGDGLVDRREDCDIAGTFTDSAGNTNVAEAVGVTCSLTCQRPGSSLATCGDSNVQPEFGEECDPGVNPTGCSATCQLNGSISEDQFEGSNFTSFCGDGLVDAASGEECDTGIDADNNGVLDEISNVTCASQTCVRLGNRLASQNWCTQNETVVVDGNGTQARQTRACLTAVSVCGNGVVENGELCEVITRDPVTGAGTVRLFGQATDVSVADTDLCNSQCLLNSACDQPGFPSSLVCSAEEGCQQKSCTFAGSSLVYSEPSLCGDAAPGIGEMAICEYQPGEYDPNAFLGLDPVQVVTAVGLGTVNPATNLQEALIEARAVQVQTSPTQRQAVNVSGRGEYSLQCGYTEYAAQRVVNNAQGFNDCPANANNDSGVGYNSCCYARPNRTREYPADGTGLLGSGTEPVCINTYIDVEYTGNLDVETMQNNVLLAQGFATPTVCSSTGQIDLTHMVTGTIALNDISESSGGFFKRLWDGIRGFFGDLFGRGAYATTQQPAIVTWCGGDISLTPSVRHSSQNGQVVSTTVRLSIDKALKENSIYAVVMRGGIGGIRDVRGVGIRPQRPLGTDDSWVFQTDVNGRICEIDTVVVTPASYVFTRPNSSTLFSSRVFDDTGAPLQPVTGVYDWSTAWGPQNNPVFSIPFTGLSTVDDVEIGSRTVEGSATGFVNLTITDNLVSRTTGTIFSGNTELRALFCENLWPSRQYYPYEDGFPRNGGPNNDGYNSLTRQFDGSANPTPVINGLPTQFNFSTGYCADSGSQSTTVDDLPYLRPLVFVETPAGGAPAATQQLIPFGSLRDSGGAAVFNRPSDIVVRGDRAYVISNRSHSLEIINVANKANPQPLSRIVHAGDPASYFKSPSALAVSGNRVYALAAGQGFGSLQVIDISNELNPQFGTSLLHSTRAQPHLNGAKNIVVEGDYAYVTVSGVEARSNGLQVFDLTDPDNPVPAGYINHGDRGARLFGAKGLFIRGNYAYVTVTGFTLEGMQIIDIADPQNLRPAGYITHSTRSPMIGAEDVFVRGNYAYVAVNGRRSASPIGTPVPALSIIDVSDPNRPQALAAIQDGAAAQLNGANNVVVVNNIAYVTAALSQAVTAINVADPTNPLYMHSLTPNTNAPRMYFSALTSMWVDNGYIYTLSSRSNSLEIIDTRALVATAPRTAGQVQLPQEIYKRYLFTNDKNQDAIGIQIFDNVARESARRWFGARHGSSQNFQSVVIGGFDAISDGNNVYVNFLNQGTVPNDIESYILLLSINSDAKNETRLVYNQLVDNLRFLINVTDVGYCSVGDNSNPQNVYTADAVASVQCRTDFNCLDIAGTNRICANAKTKLFRDWTRVGDVQRMQQEFSAVGAGTKFPRLQSGTYYQQYTNSRWPSWNQTLAAQVRSPELPSDPVNEWSSCGTRDPQTCWDAETATFFCPAVTSVYEYVVDQDGNSYTLHVPFEYFTPTGGVISQLLDPTFLSFNRWCQASTTYSPFARTCGDGIVNTLTSVDPVTGVLLQAAEECDPAGGTRLRNAVAADNCAPGERVQEICSATCSYSQPQCVARFTCGNGIVEAGEQCDDGITLNGQYGQCAGPSSPGVAACQGPHPEYCGDATPNFTDTNPLDGFRDAGTQGAEYCEVTATQFSNQGFCQKKSCLSAKYQLTDIRPTDRFSMQGINILAPNNIWAAGQFSASSVATPQGQIRQYDGTVWNTRYSDPGGAIYWGADFYNDQFGWVVGERNLKPFVVRTGDGGQNWIGSQIWMNDSRLLTVQFVNERVGYVAGTNGFIGSTVDGGQNWTTTQLGAASFIGISFVNERQGWIVSESAIYTTNDGAQTWNRQGQTAPLVRQRLRDVSFVNRSVGYVAAENGVFRSLDSGATWQDVTSNIPTTPANVFEGIHFIDQYTGIVSGQRGTVFATNDGGISWAAHGNVGGFISDVDMFSTTTAAIGGQGFISFLLTTDPYCLRTDACTTEPAPGVCQFNDRCLAINDPSYGSEKGNSCDLSCKAPGGYCGDGIVNQQYEECEVNDANCTPYCLIRTQPEQVVSSGQLGCGNGIIEAGEQCDNGLSNGQECVAGYGQNCTYCSTQCVTLTRDATAFCGDGELQRNQGEVCDVGTAPGSILAWENASEVTKACIGGDNPEDRKGEYRCIDNCRKIESTCTVCGYVEQCSCTRGVDTGNRAVCRDGRDNDGDGKIDCQDTTGGGALPQIAILNPMIGDTEASTYLATSWAAQTFYDFLRPRQLNNLPPAGNRSQWTVVQGWSGYRLVSAPSFVDYRQTYALTANGPNGLQAAGPLILNQNINTDVLCREAYYLDVNSQFIVGGIAGSPSLADLIPYPVNGEGGTVRNEYVFSPPVPESVFRVVLRWGADEFDAGARFVGRVYNNSFGDINAGVVDLTRGIAAGNLCTNIVSTTLTLRNGQQADYWWPEAGNCTPFESMVYVHPKLASNTLFTNTFVQAMTIDLRNADNVSNTVYFFVDELSGPIRAYERNRTLNVDVYEYEQGQDPLKGQYLPKAGHSFSITGAAGTSTNPTDEYWHVFNIVRSGQTGNWTVVPVQSIERDVTDVYRNR